MLDSDSPYNASPDPKMQVLAPAGTIYYINQNLNLQAVIKLASLAADLSNLFTAWKFSPLFDHDLKKEPFWAVLTANLITAGVGCPNIL